MVVIKHFIKVIIVSVIVVGEAEEGIDTAKAAEVIAAVIVRVLDNDLFAADFNACGLCCFLRNLLPFTCFSGKRMGNTQLEMSGPSPRILKSEMWLLGRLPVLAYLELFTTGIRADCESSPGVRLSGERLRCPKGRSESTPRDEMFNGLFLLEAIQH